MSLWVLGVPMASLGQSEPQQSHASSSLLQTTHILAEQGLLEKYHMDKLEEKVIF